MIDGEAEKPVVRPDLALSVADKANLCVGKTLEHLVRPNCIKGGHLLKKRDGDFHVLNPFKKGTVPFFQSRRPRTKGR